MKTALALLALGLLLPLPAPAAEEPEVVYGKFHRALIAGDIDEVQRYAVDAYRAELAAMSPAQREAQGKMAAVMPRASLRNKTVAPSQSARLHRQRPGPAAGGRQARDTLRHDPHGDAARTGRWASRTGPTSSLPA
jgi:hypothetical protein